MALRKLSASMATFGGGGSSSATAVIVADQTQAAVEAAILEAGAGGTLYFPNGEYETNGLTADMVNQTWEFGRDATIKRSGGVTLIDVQAEGLRIYGAMLDVDALGLGTQHSALVGYEASGDGFGIEVDDVTIMNSNSWGLYFTKSPFIVRRLKTINNGYAGIFFPCKEFRSQGLILVESCFIDSSNVNYKGQGGILLRVDNAVEPDGLLVNPQVRGNRVQLPEMTSVSQADEPTDLHTNSVLIEVHNSSGPVITGNQVSYGKIGISINSAIGGEIAGNTVSEAFQYGIEIAQYNGPGSTGMACIGNFVSGSNGQGSGAPAPSAGVSLSGGATKNNVVHNRLTGNSTSVLQSGGAVNNTISPNLVN